MYFEEPLSIMQKALGEQWNDLDDIVRKHYAMAPGTCCEMTIHGSMDRVFHSNMAKLFLLPGRLFGALVPYRGIDIPTKVRNWTMSDNHEAMYWHRILQFPGKTPSEFKSRMEYAGGHEIIEFVRYGLGIRMRMSVENGSLVFTSAGYVWDIGLARIPIPTWAILGDARIIEQAVSDQEFFIDFKMTHPLLGKTFAYSGTFHMQEQR